jgi:carbonic anhydrase/acetyltransferase-like protein (isoleucine patch superfamily)
MLFTLPDRDAPQVHPSCYIAHNATVIGSVTLAEDASVWFNVVIRGDAERISIGAGANIQDSAVLHADPGFPLEIGAHVTVGHKAMLHGCSVGEGSLIGINAVVLNGARIGKGCLIGANALVTENTVVPDGSMVLGSPGKVVRQLPPEYQQGLRLSAENYVLNARRFRAGLKEMAR